MLHQVQSYQATFTPLIENFKAASKKLGEPLISLSAKVNDAFQQLGTLIQYGLEHPEPSPDNEVLQPLCDMIVSIVEFKQREDLGQFSNHVSTVRESIVALGWINVKPAPKQFIKEMSEAGEYYSNRVLSSFKGNADHSDWVSAWKELLHNLHQYVIANFLTGFTWNVRSSGAGKGVPPPPPPPPADLFAAPLVDNSGDQARQALLNDINQGVHIMTRLRRAGEYDPASMVRAQPQHAKIVPQAKSAPAAKVYPPKFALEGKKWVVEHQKNERGLKIDNTEMSQSLAMYKCEDSNVTVMNKMNGVVMDTCKKTSLVTQDIISSVELIHCARCEVKCIGRVPLISLDSCDSVQIFVTEKSLDVEVISSKSNSCNICILEPNGDYVELPVPEQIKTVIKSGKKELLSSVLEKN